MTPEAADEPRGAGAVPGTRPLRGAQAGGARSCEELGLLEKVEDHRHAVGHCYRCDTVIEPRLSDSGSCRWSRSPAPALAAYRDGTPPVHSRAPGRRLRPLARGHPRLVHLPAALVGPPHPGVVLRGRGLRPSHREPDRPRRACPGVRRRRAAGRGRARHLVLLLAGAVLQPRLARADGRTSRRTTPATRWSPRPRSCSSGSRG